MIRLTIELYQEPELPDQWVSKCVELDILSAGMSPEQALEAVAEAVRMSVQYTAEKHGYSTEQVILNRIERLSTKGDEV